MQALYDWLIVNSMIKIVINWNSQFLLKLYKKKKNHREFKICKIIGV